MEIIFVRFGELPENGKSKNHLSDKYEKGISIYEAIERDGKISILLPNLTASACVTLSGCLRKKMYIVSGDIIGTGSDGEKLLKNCKIIN